MSSKRDYYEILGVDRIEHVRHAVERRQLALSGEHPQQVQLVVAEQGVNGATGICRLLLQFHG